MQNPQSGQIRLTHGLNKPSENFVGKLVGRAALWGHCNLSSHNPWPCTPGEETAGYECTKRWIRGFSLVSLVDPMGSEDRIPMLLHSKGFLYEMSSSTVIKSALDQSNCVFSLISFTPKAVTPNHYGSS